MTLLEAKEEAIEEAKKTGKRQIVFLVFETEKMVNPIFSFCESEIFENEIENDMNLLPIGEATEDSKFISLQLSLF